MRDTIITYLAVCAACFIVGFCFGQGHEQNKQTKAINAALTHDATALGISLHNWRVGQDAIAGAYTQKKAVTAQKTKADPELDTFLRLPLPNALRAGGGVLGQPVNPQPAGSASAAFASSSP